MSTMLQLFDLPLDLVTRVLFFLHPRELSILQQTHSRFRQLIHESKRFQYRFAIALAGVADNMHSTHTAPERLTLLKNREEGWLQMNIDFQKSIPKVKFASGIYDLTGGIYFRGDLSRRSIHYCQLPSRSSDTPCWKIINVEKAIVDIGVSVYEHDLIAITPDPKREGHSIIEIILVELSTGKLHPLAKQPILFISETQASKPSILLEIVGEFLVLVMTHTFRQFNPPDTLQAFEILSNILSEHSASTSHVRRVHLPISDDDTPTELSSEHPRHLGVLNRCKVATHGTILMPRSALPQICGTPHLRAPFYPDPDDAIMVLNVQLQGADEDGAYSLFVHRSSLLKVCHTNRPEDEDGVSHYIPGALTTERIPGKRVRAWSDWGPSITRVFDPCWESLHWITTTAGQRAIICHEADLDEDQDEDRGGQHPRLLDFNPYTVAKAMRELDSTATIISCIDYPILGQLPYVEIDIPFQDSWLNRHQGFLLYDEGLLVLGLAFSSSSKVLILKCMQAYATAINEYETIENERDVKQNYPVAKIQKMGSIMKLYA
ncbi:hypothetical protein C0993_005690 [Termitomyces sp. T159_Od127]|nr:hypothetical protein C0993_005690 [Termitomyces sp. T159_Od127]